MEEARELTVVGINFVDFTSNSVALIMNNVRPQPLRIKLRRDRPEITEHVIETIRRMETNTSLYAAGGFAPMLVLLNLLPFLMEHVSLWGRTLALISIALLGGSGLVLVIYRAVYINMKRTKVEIFKSEALFPQFGINNKDELMLEAFESKAWSLIISLAFLAMPIGWVVMGWLVSLILLGK